MTFDFGRTGLPQASETGADARLAARLDVDQSREHDDALTRAVERMTRREGEPVIALARRDVLVGARVDDLAGLGAVGEPPVGHLERDLVARPHLVELAERRQ